jgi:benzoyl-CoA reductase/2-hydroxyglutaryl-CoA dehydratase subunit BcrC/BadD/HgdB
LAWRSVKKEGKLNFLEREIAKYERRLKRIEQGPLDPHKLKSNKLYYALELEYRRSQLDAWRQGRPFAAATGLSPLMRAMGFAYWDSVQAADRVGQEANSYFDVVRAEGLPDYACDRTVITTVMSITGNVPVPDFILTSNHACDLFALCLTTLGYYFSVPTYYVDIGFEANNETLRYVTEQLREAIGFVESMVPGVKYDEDRLMELQELDRIGFSYYRDIYELKKRVPCPIGPRDAFREPRKPSIYHDPHKALDWLRSFRDELAERAETGMGVMSDEKLRLMWAVSGPLNFDPFEILEKRGVSLPVFQFGMSSRWYGSVYPVYGDETEYGKKLSPLEEEARMINCNAWAGLAKRWVDDILFQCRDQKIDAIVYFMQVGCVTSRCTGAMVAQEAEKQLGIPTLLLEGRMLSTDRQSQVDFQNQLSDFIDIAITRKGAL